MKIKTVEISAFRIYDDPKNAIFDFTDKRGDIANFVSLYAPNGFGKTSFYDAVEWGVTKSINRFHIRSKELEKLANFQAQKNEHPLIRNTKSVRDTYVKVVSDSKIYEEKFKKHGNQIHDINFKNHVVDDFQQVILSQEWISAFLTESDGETRYKKFMEKPDLVSINNYYNNLKLQLGVLKDEKYILNEKINQCEKEINNTIQEDLLTTINTQIQSLISEFQQQGLFQIQLSSTKEDIKKLKDVIANNKISQNKEAALNAHLDHISLAKIGDENVTGINLYFEYKLKLQDVFNNIKILESHLTGFNELEKQSNELIAINKNVSIILEQRDKCTEIIHLFYDYKKIYDSLKDKITEISNIENKISQFDKNLEIVRREEAKVKSTLDSAIEQFNVIDNKITQLPNLKELISKTKTEISFIEAFTISERAKQSNRDKEILLLNDLMSNIHRILNNLAVDGYSLDFLDDNQELIDLISKLKGKRKILSEKEGILGELNRKIKNQKKLNSTIQSFIESGLAIINERQTSTCPLCEQTFNSYTELAKRISNNKALSGLLKEMLSKQVLLLNNISSIEKEIANGKAALIEFYNLKTAELIDKVKLLKDESDKVKKEIINKENELKKAQAALTDYNIQLEGLSIDEFENALQKRKMELTNSKILSSEKLVKILSDVNISKELVESLRGNINLILKEIELLNSNEKYLKVTNWFRDNIPNSALDNDKIIRIKEEYDRQLNKMLENQKIIEKIIETESKKLASYTKEGLNIRKNELLRDRIEIQQIIDGYTNFIKSLLEVDIVNISRTKLDNLFEEKEFNYKQELNKNKRLLEEYSKLEKYSENIVVFLQSEKSRDALLKIKSELDSLNNRVEPILNEERNRTKAYLQQRIQGFFYEKLINDLYKKIDPHPEFKEVKFQADFESDSPRLDVFVRNNDDESMLIPNLYFSTAQINILSLSIFLATALNSKKYDCIFIDDPIQSMDSINALSTIDLLRSISVNHNKQIILSTHDENFHNLLKKKIPPELFKSKFLELESFGKVKLN